MGYIVPPPPPNGGFPYLVTETYRTASFSGETPDEFFKSQSTPAKVEVEQIPVSPCFDEIKEPNWDNGFEVI